MANFEILVATSRYKEPQKRTIPNKKKLAAYFFQRGCNRLSSTATSPNSARLWNIWYCTAVSKVAIRWSVNKPSNTWAANAPSTTDSSPLIAVILIQNNLFIGIKKPHSYGGTVRLYLSLDRLGFHS